MNAQNVAAAQKHSTNEPFIVRASVSHGPTTNQREKLAKLKDEEANNVDSEQLIISGAESHDNELVEYNNNTQSTERYIKQLKLETDSEGREQTELETDKSNQLEHNTIKQNCQESCKTIQKGSTEVEKQEQESLKNHIEEQNSDFLKDVSVDDVDNKNEAFKQREMIGDNTVQILLNESDSKFHNTLVGITKLTGNQVTENENESIERTKAEELCDKPNMNDGTKEPVIYTPGRRTRSGVKGSRKNTESRRRRNSRKNSQTSLSAYVCPVCCQNMLFKDLNQFNEHLDDCMVEKDINSDHFPAPAHKTLNQQSTCTVDNTVVKVETENSEHGCDKSQIWGHEKDLKIPEVLQSKEKSTPDLKETSDENHRESNRNNSAGVKSELIASSGRNKTTKLQYCFDDCKINIVQLDDSEDKERITETKMPSGIDIVTKLNTIDNSDVKEDVNQLKHINEEFGSDNEASVVEGSGSVKIDKVPIEKKQAKEINENSSLDTGDLEKVNSGMPSMCIQKSEAPFDIENQCDIITSTNENDNINEMVGKKDSQIQEEPDLPSLKPYMPDLNSKTEAENKDTHTGLFEIPLKETDNHVGDALVDSTNNNEPEICNKMLDESKVEKLIERLIDRTITGDTVEMDGIKGNECKKIKKDAKQSELDLTSESNNTVQDSERPCGSEDHQMQERDAHTAVTEDLANEYFETVMQKDIGDESTNEEDKSLLVCPICNIEQRVSNLAAFNDHVDSCLSRGTISAILKEQRGDSGNKTNLKRLVLSLS